MPHELSKISFGNSAGNLSLSFPLKSECSDSKFMYAFQLPEMLFQCSDSICFVVTVLKISNNFSCLYSHLGST